MDDSIANLVDKTTSMAIQSHRATTPILNRTPTRRFNITPQRAGSASKTRDLTRAAHEVQSCNRQLPKQAGVRRIRKWENDNLFGLLNILHLKRNHTNFADDEEMSVGLQRAGLLHPLGVNVEWRNLFSTLLTSENNHELRVYLSCCPLYSTQPVRKASLSDCQNDSDKALFAWNNIEKRVRVAVSKACISSLEARKYVSLLESVIEVALMALRDTDAEAAAASLPADMGMAHLFAKSQAIVFPGLGACSVSLAGDSAYHRLILHGVSQFHFMHSKTVTLKTLARGGGEGGKGAGVKVTHLTSFKVRPIYDEPVSFLDMVIANHANLFEEDQ